MTPLFITGQGAITAVGRDAARTIASLRGGLDGLTELPFAGATELDLRGAPIHGFAEGVTGWRRLEALATKALSECLAGLRKRQAGLSAVFLGLPSADAPWVEPDLEGIMRERLSKRLGVPPNAIRPIAEGRTSVFTALRWAAELLDQDPFGICIVGGVDSLVDPDTLQELSRRGLLAEEYDGFLPGEGAAFVCLGRQSKVGGWGRTPASVLGVGQAIESADGSAESPIVGVGMAAAMRNAMVDARLPEQAVGMSINAINGTRTQFEDEAYAQIRFLRSPRERLALWHLASYLGETGAAYGALALMWASAGLELGFAPAAGVLISAGDGRRRAAAFVQSTASGDDFDRTEFPAVGIAEPAYHTLAPISPTRQPDENDPGLPLGDVDDRHHRLAEQDLDALASLVLVRNAHLQSESPWTDIEEFERRTLSHLDALAWSGDIARDLVDTYLKGDPEEASAATMVLCCSASRGGEVDQLLEACAQSDELRAAIVESAAVCPRTLAEPFLYRLLELDPKSRADALRGLTIGQWIDLERVDGALRSLAPDILPAAAVALGAAGASHYGDWMVSQLLALPDGPELEPMLAAIALNPMLDWFWALGTPRLLETVPEAFALASLRTENSVWASIGQNAVLTRGAIVASGWSGEMASTPYLLAALGEEDEAIADEAARALARMYGVRPVERVARPEEEEPDEAEANGEEAEPDIEDDAVADADEEEDRAGGATEAPSPDKIDRLSRNRADWEQVIARFQGVPQGRLRAGRRWDRRSAVAMLLDPATPCSERIIAAWEHAIVNGQPLPVHPRQWVATQRQRIAAASASQR